MAYQAGFYPGTKQPSLKETQNSILVSVFRLNLLPVKWKNVTVQKMEIPIRFLQ